SVSTRRAAGSMDLIVVRTNPTPGLTTSRYECLTASGTVRPNITSSLEKPNTNPSAWSISTMSASSPSTSDSRVVSSRPPKPAPRTRIRMDFCIPPGDWRQTRYACGSGRRLRDDPDVGLGLGPLAEDLLGLVVGDRAGDHDVFALLPVHRRGDLVL